MRNKLLKFEWDGVIWRLDVAVLARRAKWPARLAVVGLALYLGDWKLAVVIGLALIAK